MLRRCRRVLSRWTVEGCKGGISVKGENGLDMWLLEGHICTLCMVRGKNGGVVMVDGGYKADGDTVAKFVKDNGLGVVEAVVCTHAHPDHCMGFGRHDKAYAPKGIASWYAGWYGRVQLLIDYGLGAAVGVFKGKPLLNPFGPFSYRSVPRLQHGEVVPESPDWTVVSIPGHTNHMIGLYHAKERVLYAADLFVILGAEKMLPPIPVDYGDVYVETAKRLEELGVRGVVLAHGGLLVMKDERSWGEILREITEKSARSTQDDRKSASIIVKLTETGLVGWNSPPVPSLLPISAFTSLNLPSSEAAAAALTLPSNPLDKSVVHTTSLFTRIDPTPLPTKLPPLRWFSTLLGFTLFFVCTFGCVVYTLYWSLCIITFPIISRV
eukprot:TRINITY_DN39333_c0_g1_i1.p1 TRINITY_DN39333_c0_g1~~TRINITY_DN39333_c0_g1_i1.p1  ORF type:complete len:381 (+),score=27.60 TRINITY_DN39333_c0_g1_i1:61-1203(+)